MRKKILLVEDDKELREIILEQLSDLNLQISVASFADEAIELLKNELKVDFVVSDYSMPFGNGLKLLEYLAINKYSIPFVFFTHDINPELTKYSHFLGVISKFNIAKLKKILKGI